MAQKYYLAGFEKQGTGSALGWKNCGAASGAMLADQATLGLKNPSSDAFRRATNDFSGGLNIAQIGSTLENKYGVGNTIYDASDGYHWVDMLADLKRGKFMVANGDYDQVPYALKGDKNFTGLHSVLYQQVDTLRSRIRVGDSLNDGRRPGIPKGYVWWPLDVAKNYVEKFDRQVRGDGLHAAVMDLQRVKSRGSYGVNVRASSTTASSILGTIRGSTTLVFGGTVKGQSIAGNSTWYRVWYPRKARIAYVHSSVVKKA